MTDRARHQLIYWGMAAALSLLSCSIPALAQNCTNNNAVADGTNTPGDYGTVTNAYAGLRLDAGKHVTVGICGTPYCLLNNGTSSYFVPSRTQAEWNSFLAASAGLNIAATAGACAPPTCPAATENWNSNCSGSAPAGVASGGSTVIINTASGYSGSATYTCTSGIWGGPTGATCTALPAGCTGKTLSWGSACSGSTSSVGNGSTSGATNTVSGYSGSATFTCSNGNWIYSSGGCSSNAPSGSWSPSSYCDGYTLITSYSCTGGNGQCSGSAPAGSSSGNSPSCGYSAAPSGSWTASTYCSGTTQVTSYSCTGGNGSCSGSQPGGSSSPNSAACGYTAPPTGTWTAGCSGTTQTYSCTGGNGQCTGSQPGSVPNSTACGYVAPPTGSWTASCSGTTQTYSCTGGNGRCSGSQPGSVPNSAACGYVAPSCTWTSLGSGVGNFGNCQICGGVVKQCCFASGCTSY